MEKVGVESVDVIEESLATVDLSKVTMRKHKKPKDVTGVIDPSTFDSFAGKAGAATSAKSNHDFIEDLFGVSLKTPKDIDDFTKDLDNGQYPKWAELDSDVRVKTMNAIDGLWESFMDVVNDKSNSSPSAAPVCEGVNISIPRKVVEKVSSRLEHTLYGYFMGKRMAYPVVEYFAKNNWAKHGLKKIMMNSEGFFFFKFDTLVGLEAVLKGGPWMIRNSPIILKKWSVDTRFRKEELTSIPIWVKLHDVPLQVFEEEGINLIASFIGKPVLFDSYTTSMCKDSWGRSSFARCLIEVNSGVDLVEVVTIGFPSLAGEDFTKETIRVEYEWRPPRCDICKIFGHAHDHCPKKVVSTPVVSTSHVVTPTVVSNNDGFHKVVRKKKKSSKAKSTNANQFAGPSGPQTVSYQPKGTARVPIKEANTMGNASKSMSMLKTTGSTSKEGIFITFNPYVALVNEEDDIEVHVAHVSEGSAHPITSESPSFTVAVG